MRGGQLDRLIDLQRNSGGTSDSGAPIEGWADVALRRPARYRALEGAERYTGPAITATQQIEFMVRWAQAVADLNPKDRVIYPARELPTDPVVLSHTYNILAVNEVGRREQLQIIAERMPDQ